VYMHIISQVIQQGKNAIMLVPEISLTPQVMGNFKARFGDNVALLHSGLSDGEKFDEWQRIREGDVRIVIGARSAIFAPIKDIGAIILDEEHDPSYKSENNPRYLTHDVAKFRAEHNHCPLILGSATPSLESFYAAKQNKYTLHELPERANKKAMPSIQVVNMCTEMLNGNMGVFSGQLIDDLRQCIAQNNQAMLFINRRGHSSYMICRECGYIPKCEDCDVSLVYHSEDNQLKCHYCSKRYKALTNCPKCGSSYIRYGIMGTQKIVQELQKEFPNVKILRMDNDTTSTKNALTNLLQEFVQTKPCILVGTQMIAKGHDFPDVTLVGVVNADMSLHYSDYRSVERTFELITQVAGRAGRAEKPGKVVIQTYTPNHYLYRFVANYNYPGFFDKEINLRQVTAFPPFAKIVRVLISSENDEKARKATMEIFKQIKLLELNYANEFLYCEAMKSPLSKIQKKYRYQILMRFKLTQEQQIIDKIYEILDGIKMQGIQSFIEINPSNMS
ncbi:MAG: primosomal protein N', partial [Clostridia bacterium]|nr:primosomal protein N' [Clostridia bacterium]